MPKTEEHFAGIWKNLRAIADEITGLEAVVKDDPKTFYTNGGTAQVYELIMTVNEKIIPHLQRMVREAL